MSAAEEEKLYSKIVFRLSELKKARRDDSLSQISVVETQKRIRNYIDQIFEINVHFAVERDLESIFWKDVFYRSFETYQKQLKKSNSQRTVELLRAYLESTTGFYVRLLNRISGLFSLDLLAICSGSLLSEKSPKIAANIPEWALTACFRCLIHLGDLARYRDVHGEKWPKVFSGAIRYYNAAHLIQPTNGNAHNQLAVVATYKNDKITALYQYYRAILHDFPIAQKNVRLLLKSNSEETSQKVESLRKETIYADFAKLFLELHEALLYETELQHVPELEKSLMKKFQHLLESRVLKKSEYVAIAMLNISAYHIIKESCPKSESFTCALMMKLFFQLVEECNRLIVAAGKIDRKRPFDFRDIPATAKEMLPAIRIHVKHLLVNSELIEFKHTAEFVPIVASGWKAYASTIQVFRNITFPRTASRNAHRMLEEDLECLGFTPVAKRVGNSLRDSLQSPLGGIAESSVRTRDMIADAKELPTTCMPIFSEMDGKKAGTNTRSAPSRIRKSTLTKAEESDDEEVILLSLPSRRNGGQDGAEVPSTGTKNNSKVNREGLEIPKSTNAEIAREPDLQSLEYPMPMGEISEDCLSDKALYEDQDAVMRKMVDDIARSLDLDDVKICGDNFQNQSMDESALWDAIPKNLLDETMESTCEDANPVTPHFTVAQPLMPSARPTMGPQAFPLSSALGHNIVTSRPDLRSPPLSSLTHGSPYFYNDSQPQSSYGSERFSAFNSNGDGQYHNFFGFGTKHSTAPSNYQHYIGGRPPGLPHPTELQGPRSEIQQQSNSFFTTAPDGRSITAAIFEGS